MKDSTIAGNTGYEGGNIGFMPHDQSCVCFLLNKHIKYNLAGNTSYSTITCEPPSGLVPTFIHTAAETSDIIFHHFSPLGYCYNRNITITTNVSNFNAV